MFMLRTQDVIMYYVRDVFYLCSKYYKYDNKNE